MISESAARCSARLALVCHSAIGVHYARAGLIALGVERGLGLHVELFEALLAEDVVYSLPHSVRHVSRAIRRKIRRKRTDRLGLLYEGARVAHQAERGIEAIAPRMRAPVRCARRLLPFGLGRQPVRLAGLGTEPAAVGHGRIPVHAQHRVIVAAGSGAAVIDSAMGW